MEIEWKDVGNLWLGWNEDGLRLIEVVVFRIFLKEILEREKKKIKGSE